MLNLGFSQGFSQLLKGTEEGEHEFEYDDIMKIRVTNFQLR